VKQVCFYKYKYNYLIIILYYYWSCIRRTKKRNCCVFSAAISDWYQDEFYCGPKAFTKRLNHHPPCHPEFIQDLRWMMSHAW